MFYEFEYIGDMKIFLKDAVSCIHSGSRDAEVLAISKKPYIAKQLAKIDREQLRFYLDEYGAWNEQELQDHSANLQRFLWLAAGKILDEYYEKRK